MMTKFYVIYTPTNGLLQLFPFFISLSSHTIRLKTRRVVPLKIEIFKMPVCFKKFFTVLPDKIFLS